MFIVHPSLVREPSALSPDNPFASIFQSLIRHIFGQTKHTRYMLLQRFMYTLVVHHHGIKPRWVKNGMLSRWKTRVFHVHVPFCYAASCSLFPCTKPRTLPAFPSLHDASSIVLCSGCCDLRLFRLIVFRLPLFLLVSACFGLFCLLRDFLRCLLPDACIRCVYDDYPLCPSIPAFTYSCV